MLKKTISLVLALVMVLSLFVMAPVTSASAASYKDNIIEAVLDYEWLWWDEYTFGFYGTYSCKFLDLNYDGNLEFIVTTPGGSMGNVSNHVYYYSNGRLVQASGGENNDAVLGYSDLGSSLKSYYNKSTGKFMTIGGSYFKGDATYFINQNYELTFDGTKLGVKYFSANILNYGKYTYYNGAKSYGNVSGYSKISKATYDSINKNKIKNCVNANMKSKTVELDDWDYYSTSYKRTKLYESYNGYSMSKTLVTMPNLTKFEGQKDGVKLFWKAVTGAKNYRIYEKSGSTWNAIANVSGTSYVDKNIKYGQSKTYTIRCTSANGKYHISSYHTTGHGFKLAGIPALKSATYVSGGVKINWSKPTGAVKYRVFAKSNGSSWQKIGDTTGTSFVHKNGVKGRNYTYTVRCISSTGKNYTSSFDSKGLTKTFKK